MKNNLTIIRLFILKKLTNIAENEQCTKPEILKAILTHKLMPKEYHYEPLGQYTRDDFQ
jgi:hypothetical protein